MTQLRKGDLVTFTARVTDVASYAEKDKPDQQQIQVKILPNGKELGWCLPKENAFEPKKYIIKEGDEVSWNIEDSNLNWKTYNVLLIDEETAVLKAPNGILHLAFIGRLIRI